MAYPFTLPDLPSAYDALEPHIDGVHEQPERRVG